MPARSVWAARDRGEWRTTVRARASTEGQGSDWELGAMAHSGSWQAADIHLELDDQDDGAAAAANDIPALAREQSVYTYATKPRRSGRPSAQRAKAAGEVQYARRLASRPPVPNPDPYKGL